MGALQKLASKAFNCANGLLMPDGNEWCSFTMKPCSECSDNFKNGRFKIYKQEPQTITPNQEAHKVKVKEIKPIPIKQKPIRSSKKTSSPQIKLF